MDYREMLEQRDIDVAIIDTPDHCARAADDRSGQGGHRRQGGRTRSASTSSKRRPCLPRRDDRTRRNQLRLLRGEQSPEERTEKDLEQHAMVDGILPLDIRPAPTSIVRVFVGHMEIVTPAAVSTLEAARRPTMSKRSEAMGGPAAV
jgi:hypothetical protein